MVKDRKRVMQEINIEFNDMLKAIKKARVDLGKEDIDKPISSPRLTRAIARMKTNPSIKDILINSELEDGI